MDDRELENLQEDSLDTPTVNEDFLQEDSEGIRVLESQLKEKEVQEKYRLLNQEISKMVEEGIVGGLIDETRERDIHFLRSKSKLPEDLYRQLEQDYQELQKGN